MKENYVNKNGNLVLKSELNLGINRAMRFGDGLFETIRIINGDLVWWTEHFDRLQKGMRYLKLDLPELFIDELLVDCLATIHRNQIKEGGILRVFVFRKGSGGYIPTNYDFEYLIETVGLSSNKFSLNKNGLKIGISNTVTINPSDESELKTLNKIPYIRAGIEAVNMGWDDILILNQKAKLVEASSSNLFIIKNGEILTPRVIDGILKGVARQKLIELAKENDWPIRAKDLKESDLLEAEEVFLSNSISGIRWVGSFKNKRYFNKHSKQILGSLQEFIGH